MTVVVTVVACWLSPWLCLSIYYSEHARVLLALVVGEKCRGKSSSSLLGTCVQMRGVRKLILTITILIEITVMGCSQNTGQEQLGPTPGVQPKQIPCSPDQIAKYINDIRTNPKKYAQLLQKQLDGSFKDYYSIKISQDVLYRTNEGKKAWEQAIEFLNKVEPLPPMQIHQGLCKAAADHAQDLANLDELSHIGSDQSQPLERVLRHCKKGLGKTGQNIGTDFNLKNRNFAQATIVGLVIDDGVSDRGHRLSVFDKDFLYFGSATRVQNKDKGEKIITVINYLSKNWETLP